MKYYLKTPYPCMIKTTSETMYVDENDTLEIDDEKILFVYPESNKQIPFCVNLTTKNESDYFSFFFHQNKNYILLEKPSDLVVCQIESLNFSGKTCKIYVSNNSIKFETDKKSIIYQCHHKCLNYKVFKLKNFACIQFDHDLYSFSMDTNKLVHFEGDSFLFEDDVLTVAKNFSDSTSRIKTAKYKFEENISVDTQSFQSNSTTNTTIETLPYRFLEGVRAKDYQFIKSCLSDNLKTQLDDEALKKFFGNLQQFLPLNEKEFIIFANNKKYFLTFSLENEKVSDIAMDNLG